MVPEPESVTEMLIVAVAPLGGALNCTVARAVLRFAIVPTKPIEALAEVTAGV